MTGRIRKIVQSFQRLKRKYGTFFRMLALIAALVGVYSVLFHIIMLTEGRDYSAVTGIYWTLTTMSTLGYGDIVFHSDLGHLFATIVLLSGVVTLLILLPFTFIKFFYEPWVESREAERTPRTLPAGTRDHVILTRYEPIAISLVEKFKQFSIPYVVIVEQENEALKMYDRDLNAVVGKLSDPDTYRRLYADRAALVATTHTDILNTNIAFTVREVAGDSVPVAATADHHDSVDILELAGSDHVIEVSQMLGHSLARRVSGGDSLAHEIGRLGELVIAEAKASRHLVGKRFNDLDIRSRLGINAAGVWERGQFRPALGDVEITENMTLVLAGTEQAIALFNQEYGETPQSSSCVIIIGGGRVGQAAAAALRKRGIDYRIVEKDPALTLDNERTVVGDAAAREILDQAGISNCSSVIVTTNNDDVNIYLTLYCRRLRPAAEIISRGTLERNVHTLHRAGADFVISYAMLGASTIFSLLKGKDILMIAEGLNVFTTPVPEYLVGKSVEESRIRPLTGCSVLAIKKGQRMDSSFDLKDPLKEGQQLALIGDAHSESVFASRFVTYQNKKH